MLAEAKKAKKHIVVFQDEEGNVLKTSFVSHEEAALPPKMPEKKGESKHHEVKFQGWDKDISCVQENLVVKAVYKEVPKEYLVMYFHENGKMLGTETVPYGQAAKEPYHPQKPQTKEYNYIFKGWNNDLSHIEKDTMAKAVFEERRRSFAVRFFHEDGTLLKEEKIVYGQAAHAPDNPVKQSDEVYYYVFDRWDTPFDNVKENTEVHAVFSPIYNEYTVRIYEEREGVEKEHLVEEKLYHYGDIIAYPELRKKGYTLQWDIHPETVRQNEEIHASWIFSNPAGKVFEIAENRYQIINPSITNGSVRLLYYREDNVRIDIPEKVKIGDYYYFIEEIASKAFKDCLKMRELTVPDCVQILEKEALASCRRLEKITLGKSRNSRLHVIGKGAFGQNEHLRIIYLNGRNLQKVYPASFEKVRKTVKIAVLPSEKAKIEKLLQRSLQEGRILIGLL